MAILLGDIGGTHARFAWVVNRKMQTPQVLNCDDFCRPIDLLDFVIKCSKNKISGIFLSIAGPVHNGRVDWTNKTGWHLSESMISKKYQIQNVKIVNDMVAQGLGLNLKNHNPALLMNIGTGMGCCLIINQVVCPCEFGLVLDEQNRKKEYMLSGMGVVRFYHQNGGNKQIKSAKKIDEMRLLKHDKIATKAYQDFYRLWGKTAGNIATGLLTKGGVYLWGGLVPKNEKDMKDFLSEFHHDHYPLFNRKIPVHIVRKKSLSLLGLMYLSKC